MPADGAQAQPRFTTDFDSPDWDRRGLPAWTYTHEGLCELEKEHLFRRRWQLACHVSDTPQSGDYVCFDMAGERAIIIRGADGEIRAFHNVCRHRGSRVLAKESGRCKGAMVCPFHGWVYNLDGTLRGAAQPESYPSLDPKRFGLKPIEMEIWRGFVFIRFKPSEQPSIAEILRRFEAELEPYGMERFVPVKGGADVYKASVNWKSVRDVDNEGYHIAMAHPGLNDLYGHAYLDEPYRDGASRSYAGFNAGPGRLWSVKRYKKLLPLIATQLSHLPESHRNAWLYIGLFPNCVIGLYPDSMIFYQEFPISAARTLQRNAIYRHAVEDRAMRLARYLSKRIDRDAAEEDAQLTVWSCEAVKSSGYDGVYLSDLERGVRSHHDHLREALPVMARTKPPSDAEIQALLG